ncbi:septation protein A [Thalassotalea sp. G2M2-11]|uniref:septation protein A n=1 Tax=Thalassotalea sp. G2M2-11 TaxID=2787627 RepID=UPI0019D04F87|nr:septation protein A [Thalassotalea sp. G2M2-11]
MHALFEYLPLIIFFVIYKFGDLYWATGSLIVTSALQILYYLYKKQPVPKRNWIFFGLIAVFGGLTIFLQNDAFIKWKVTIINAIFACALLISNHVFNKNLIKEMMSENLPLPDFVWSRLNLAWATFFLICAVLNIYIAYNYSQETWVNFKVFGLMGLTLVFAVLSVFSLYKYLPQDEQPSTSNKDNN